MQAIDMARRLAQLGETGEALRAYALVLGSEAAPAETLEAAAYTLQNGGEYKLAYTAFVSLYNAGHFRADILPIMLEAFYQPNEKPLKSRYERNVRLLQKYPYLFRKDFLPFDKLPLVFFPYDDNGGYVPYVTDEDRFLGYVNPDDPVVGRNFFRDLEKPVLARNVTSRYELRYLNDNVRPSEWAGRENHIYLHYEDWGEFCSWLQIWNLKPLLESKKFVFLIGDEISRYPLDFQAEFGVDYTQYPIKPFGIREVNKLIWHTQLWAHNGGDLFNEVFDSHPNLLYDASVMFDDVLTGIAGIRAALARSRSASDAQSFLARWNAPELVSELYNLRDRTDKDILVAMYLRGNLQNPALDRASRIVPALFFQPHFSTVKSDLVPDGKGNAALVSSQMDALHKSSLLEGFRYIKTFTPIRRPTSSHGGTMRFMWNTVWEARAPGEAHKLVNDALAERILSRNDLRDPDDRLFHDAVLVRFEDGKTNPAATFAALAAFVDLPYTESMTYGSINGNRDPHGMGEAYQNGFGLWSLDARYDEFENDAERYIIEYFLRTFYQTFGYNFWCYDGAEVDEARLDQLLGGCTTIDHYIRESWKKVLSETVLADKPPEAREAAAADGAEQMVRNADDARRRIARALLAAPRFINRSGKPLSPIPLLRPCEELMEREWYH